MGINIRQKGANGEREIQSALEYRVRKVARQIGVELPATPIIQRNQNQSAVGGSDLSNTFGLCIEVKRQETLNINTWWEQCCTAAKPNKEVPVLLYRQNGKKWKCVLIVQIDLPVLNSQSCVMNARAEISWDAFLEWFEQWVMRKLEKGELPRV